MVTSDNDAALAKLATNMAFSFDRFHPIEREDERNYLMHDTRRNVLADLARIGVSDRQAPAINILGSAQLALLELELNRRKLPARPERAGWTRPAQQRAVQVRHQRL